MSEAKRHHYIPQFILKNFLDNKGQVFYWDIEKEVLEKRNPRSIFMNFDMYRDEVNHKDKPTSIESSLAIFEGEIATLIRQKFLKDNEIIITRSELEALRIFLSLLSFRSDLRKDQYKNCKFNGVDWLFEKIVEKKQEHHIKNTFFVKECKIIFRVFWSTL